MGKPVKYRVDKRTSLSAPEIRALSATSFATGPRVEALVVTGECPTCEHTISDTISVDAIVVDQTSSGADDSSDTELAANLLQRHVVIEDRQYQQTDKVRRPILVTCRCASEHSGRPKGVSFGCGRTWMVDAEFAPALPGGAVTLHRPSPESLALWWVLDDLERAGTTALPSVRSAADKWQKALTAIVGTSAITALIGGRDALEKIGSDHQKWVTGLWAAAIVFGSVSAYLGHKASIGEPSVRFWTSRTELATVPASQAQRARSAVGSLRLAAQFGAASLVCAVAAVAILWLAPKAPADPSPSPKYVQVTKIDDKQDCGEVLAPTNGNDGLRIRKLDGGVVAIGATQIKQIAPIEACP